MSVSADSTAQPKVTRSRFQFSLRVLLAAFTLFAIGFPIWYRWPYREVITTYVMAGGQPDKSKPTGKYVRTWQRAWGGGRLKHGPWVFESADGNERHEDHYENDVLNGVHR